MYKKESIKAMERQRRGNSEKIILTGEATKRPVDWAGFLSNDENKAQLIKLLLKVWTSDNQAPKFKGRKVILICDGKASVDVVHTMREDLTSLDSDQTQELCSIVSMGKNSVTSSSQFAAQILMFSLSCCTMLSKFKVPQFSLKLAKATRNAS